MIQSYKDMIVYKKAYQLCLEVYAKTKKFPKDEKYGIVSQIRRCSVSIPSNIAEGYRRSGRKEYTQFLKIAFGSCAELETQLSISRDLGYIVEIEFNCLYGLQEEVSKLLNGTIRSVEQTGNERAK